jgi:glycosyltransferase involved in cell wall biosynthesis
MSLKILYLYAEVMGYTMATIEKLSSSYGAELHVFHWDKKRQTPYVPEKKDNVHFYPRSSLTKKEMIELSIRINPNIIVISGWQDKGYLGVARVLRNMGIPVVTCFDDQWHGTIRQYIASYCGFLLKKYFSHAWVAGPLQYEYARRLGFQKNEIIFNLLSADIKIWNSAYDRYIEKKRMQYPHVFLYVGRFEKEKGLDLLINAWDAISGIRKDWRLKVIGCGSISHRLKNIDGLDLSEFLPPNILVKEVENAGCFVLPSRHEQWGVVLQEFAVGGLPLLCSDTCGAGARFLINGLNGYYFKTGDVVSLKQQMQGIVAATNDQLLKMSQYSNILGQSITPEYSAASLMSIL